MLLELYGYLRDCVDTLSFSWPAVRVYNPLSYAWDGLAKYIKLSGSGHKRVIFVGINPGPYGMAQTGIPFGEVNAVKNFLGIHELNITRPMNEHPSYRVNGLECRRSEVSGRRLWGLFRDRFKTSSSFFRENIVLNYCPLLFLSEGARSGTLRNITPDKLAMTERKALFSLCDDTLSKAIAILEPEYVVGIGNMAYERARRLVSPEGISVVKILHPSPASPLGNRDWAGRAASQLVSSGVWS